MSGLEIGSYVFMYLVVGIVTTVIAWATTASMAGYDEADDDRDAARSVLMGLVWPLTIVAVAVFGTCWLLFRGLPWVVRNADLLPRRGRREIDGADEQWVEKPDRLRRLRRKR